MASKKKVRAAQWVCQSKELTAEAIRALGDAQRELTRVETEINDQIAAITAAGIPVMAHTGLNDRLPSTASLPCARTCR